MFKRNIFVNTTQRVIYVCVGYTRKKNGLRRNKLPALDVAILLRLPGNKLVY